MTNDERPAMKFLGIIERAHFGFGGYVSEPVWSNWYPYNNNEAEAIVHAFIATCRHRTGQGGEI